MFPHTVTIYNKYTVAQEERWQRTVLRGVFWDSTKGAQLRKAGVASADGLTLIIPQSVVPGYIKPKAWAELADKVGRWTLQSGDIVIKGEVAHEVERSTKELLGYDDLLTITAVDSREYGGDMAHWEVTGR